jgi:6-phosphogluconolactonase
MPTSTPELFIVDDRASLAYAAAARFADLAREATNTRRRFAVALSGGSTPRDLYTLLASGGFAAQVDWSRVHCFWGDERAVPPDHPDSNYRMAHETLLSRVPIPAANVHRIAAEKNAEVAAREYERDMQAFFDGGFDVGSGDVGSGVALLNPPESGVELPTQAGAGVQLPHQQPQYLPRFDLILLGLGADGHTASLFPHTRALAETSRWVVANAVPQLQTTRITLTVPVINAAAQILFLVAGEDKAEALHAVLRGAYNPETYPAQMIQPTNGKLVWFVDRAAARQSALSF